MKESSELPEVPLDETGCSGKLEESDIYQIISSYIIMFWFTECLRMLSGIKIENGYRLACLKIFYH